MTEERRERLGQALGRIPSGLFIITVRAGDDTNAFLASWVQQAGFTPPTVTVGIQEGRYALELLDRGAAFAVNVLAAGDSANLKHFGKGFEPGQDPFAGVETERTESGVEVLTSALAWLECRFVGRHPAGDHVTVFGEVLSGKMRDGGGDPYVWTRKSGFSY